MLIHDEYDNVVPYEQSVLMFNKASDKNIPCELITLNGVRHNIDFGFGYNMSPPSDEVVGMILDFIYRYS